MIVRLFFIFSLLFFFNCTKKDLIYEPTNKLDPYVLYQDGMKAFDRNDFFFASKKFSEAELNFDKIQLAAKSSIMSSFCLYSISFYNEAIDSLNTYLKNYPSDKNVIYAHYLIAIIYFEQISDEKKDLEPLLKAKANIEFFIKKYPNTDYAIDLKFKKDLILNQLAAKEMFVAKFYISTQKWIPAINRLKIVVRDFDKTIFIEEALHRLVEIHYHLGLENEAKKYAQILGYNYNSSEWFKQSYKILNKDYDFKTKKTVEKDNLLKKILKIIK
tara:strand:- start:1044 stop:1859 length:816 start_codon:yes stop_codon:yes gene_type:complete